MWLTHANFSMRMLAAEAVDPPAILHLTWISPLTITMLRACIEFLRSEDAATAIEYAVMLALIVIACIGSVLAMSNAAGQSFDDSAAQLSTAMGGS
jgi:pilus assembly protein Flp/PilA